MFICDYMMVFLYVLQAQIQKIQKEEDDGKKYLVYIFLFVPLCLEHEHVLILGDSIARRFYQY